MPHVAVAPSGVTFVLAANITLSDITIAPNVMSTTAVLEIKTTTPIPNLIRAAIVQTRAVGTATADTTTAGRDEDHSVTATMESPAPSCLNRGRRVYDQPTEQGK